tara:strand:+ start:180 stop:1592 length:1413 start_codon:yes stop_codon:yes gene_type:complete
MSTTTHYWYLDIKELENYLGVNEFTVGPFGGGHGSMPRSGARVNSQGGSGFRLGVTNRYPRGFQVEWDNLDPTGQDLNPIVLIDELQAAFNQALNEGRTIYRYKVKVKAHATDQNEFPSLQGNHRAIVLEYEISADGMPDGWGSGFDILFRTGDHGTTTNAGGDPDYGGDKNNYWPVAGFSVLNEPDPVVFSTPFCTQTVMITDRPPMPPDIVFVPYVGVNNKVMVLFSSNMGELEARPIILKNSDAAFIVEEYYSQKGIVVTEEQVLTPDTGELTRPKLEYRNDDETTKYELFRIDKKPTSYDDFRGRHLTDEPIQTELTPSKISTSPSFVDTLQPNTTYWYCARAIDVHDNISNPTHIFEIELVDNKGQMYMRHKVIKFDSHVLNYKKMGRKILAIEPRNTQMVYDTTNPPSPVALHEAPTNNILGTSEVRTASSIWDKKFKVRITSKKTGRKIDLNLTFKNTGVVIP